MKKNYNIIDDFICGGQEMIIVGMNGAACVMSKEDYNRIIIAEHKYRQKKRKVA